MLRSNLKQIESSLEEALRLLDAGQLDELKILLEETRIRVADTYSEEFPSKYSRETW